MGVLLTWQLGIPLGLEMKLALNLPKKSFYLEYLLMFFYLGSFGSKLFFI
jgi:hypothetical protein